MRKLIIAPIHQFRSDYRNPFPTKLSLEGGYSIEKFNQRTLESAFDFFHESFSGRDRDELRNCEFAIFYRYNSDNTAPEIPKEIAEDINRILITLRVVKRTRSLVTMFHFFVKGGHKEVYQIVHPPLLNITFPPSTSPGNQEFERSDATKIRKYWRGIKFLYENFAGVYHKVLNALFFFELGHHNHLYKPRLVHFVTCLESLFNTDPQQIGRTLKLRCSRFLEKDPQATLNLSREIRDIYNLRSLFVHGQGAPRRLMNNPTLQTHLLSRAEEITRMCLQKILERGLITVFGNVTQLERELEKLELGNSSALR